MAATDLVSCPDPALLQGGKGSGTLQPFLGFAESHFQKTGGPSSHFINKARQLQG